MERVALLNGENINQDYDLSKILESIITPWVVEWLMVTTNQVSAWFAFVPVTRWSVTFNVMYENTTNLTIDTTLTKKVWIAINQTKVNDWSTNNIDWTWIWSIVTWASYPASNYIPLASITAWVITDERKMVQYNTIYETKSSNIAAATNTNLNNATGNTVHITWAGVSIADLWWAPMPIWSKFTLIFDWINTLVHNAWNLICPTSANIVTAVWDTCVVVCEWSFSWRIVSYMRANWQSLDNSLSITGLTEKTSIVSNDLLVISDSEAAWVNKKLKYSSLLSKVNTDNAKNLTLTTQTVTWGTWNSTYYYSTSIQATKETICNALFSFTTSSWVSFTWVLQTSPDNTAWTTRATISRTLFVTAYLELTQAYIVPAWVYVRIGVMRTNWSMWAISGELNVQQ